MSECCSSFPLPDQVVGETTGKISSKLDGDEAKKKLQCDMSSMVEWDDAPGSSADHGKAVLFLVW